MTNNDFQKGEIIIYKTVKNEVELKVKLEKETIWLTQNQIALLFNTQRPAITKHLKNIFKSGELEEKVVSSILEHTTQHGAIKGKTQIQNIKFYNLDAIISVGYRVNSQRATQFRIWATKILKQYLVKGYVINEKRLLEAQDKFHELQEAILFLQTQSKKELLLGQETEILNLLADYSKTFSLLEQYDKGKLIDEKGKKTKFILQYESCCKIIIKLKKELTIKKEASDLFGQERGGNFEGIIKGLYQTFDKKELYPAIEDKSSHLLYLIIKDHPFSDGNKRTASFLFVYFLDQTNYLFKKSGERKINDNALVALALLIAESNPKDKEIMIKIIKNLIAK
ncbi:virulence protein RhuM/Fic/DOC family protein [Patescibacteria group bacterium]|nr:virulence protein RhuM/Fic/DOC family protein [Patescibacteria group bacterium]MBU1662972.1 virulence protein RhuM/Fic/DOC family protein [Patescibacteria group bacterium]MBU1933937.1 virulence protein RhuM/Fic/DOC family protein [Patescibacteria group bacterium]MBU2264481.1 virulence protein RhuM/Fic/DOC family protein [Patescibacteria group bacterium]